jgi:hypothetical protein
MRYQRVTAMSERSDYPVFGWQLEPVPGAPLAFWRLPENAGGQPGQPIPRAVIADPQQGVIAISAPTSR